MRPAALTDARSRPDALPMLQRLVAALVELAERLAKR